MDRGPAADARSVEAEAVLEGAFVEFVDGEGQVLPRPHEVCETNRDELRLLVFGVLQDRAGHEWKIWIVDFPVEKFRRDNLRAIRRGANQHADRSDDSDK